MPGIFAGRASRAGGENAHGDGGGGAVAGKPGDGPPLAEGGPPEGRHARRQARRLPHYRGRPCALPGGSSGRGPVMSVTRDRVRQLVDELPEENLAEAAEYLEWLAGE